MQDHSDLIKHYTNWPDSRLLSVLLPGSGYTDQALSVARTVLEKRQVDVASEMQQLQRQQELQAFEQHIRQQLSKQGKLTKQSTYVRWRERFKKRWAIYQPYSPDYYNIVKEMPENELMQIFDRVYQDLRQHPSNWYRDRRFLIKLFWGTLLGGTLGGIFQGLSAIIFGNGQFLLFFVSLLVAYPIIKQHTGYTICHHSIRWATLLAVIYGTLLSHLIFRSFGKNPPAKNDYQQEYNSKLYHGFYSPLITNKN